MMEHNRDIKRKNPVAEMNESKILMSLSEHPKTFTELIHRTYERIKIQSERIINNIKKNDNG
jgi:hypothetical protein